MGLGVLVPVVYFSHNNLDFLPDKNSIQRFEVCQISFFEKRLLSYEIINLTMIFTLYFVCIFKNTHFLLLL